MNNFVVQARAGFYDGLTFHRVVPGFVIQGGDPEGSGRGGPGYTFADEPVKAPYVLGALAMANAGPDTNGSQFFICIDDCQDKLQPLYNLFGNVTSGIEVAQAIQVGDKMRKVTVTDSVTRGLNLAALHEAVAGRRARARVHRVARSAAHLGRRHRSHPPPGRRPARPPASGCHGPLAELAGWESPHDHVALYLHNGNEYLEGMLGSAKARCAGDQRQLPLRRRGAPLRAAPTAPPPRSSSTARFAADAGRGPARLSPRCACCSRSTTDSGAALLPGAVAYEDALRRPPPRLRPPTCRPTTSTSSTPAAPPACPRACSGARPTSSPRASASTETTDERWSPPLRGTRLRALPAPPFMHGAAHWNALSAWIAGGTVVIQDDPARLDPHDVLDTRGPGAGHARC